MIEVLETKSINLGDLAGLKVRRGRNQSSKCVDSRVQDSVENTYYNVCPFFTSFKHTLVLEARSFIFTTNSFSTTHFPTIEHIAMVIRPLLVDGPYQ